jgi:hypothetical protein
VLELDVFNLDREHPELRHAKEVGLAFGDGQEYINAFLGLYLDEVRAEIEASVRDISTSNQVKIRFVNKPGPVYASFTHLQPQGFEFADNFRPDDLILCVEDCVENTINIPRRFDQWRANPPGYLTFAGIVEQEANGRQLYVKTRHNEGLQSALQNRGDMPFLVFSLCSLITVLREFRMI